MSHPLSKILLFAMAAFVVLSGLAVSARPSGPGEDQVPDFSFRAPVPLGVEAFQLRPVGRKCFIMASVVNPALDGVHVVRELHGGSVTGPDGTPMPEYPAVLEFRVTASAMNDDLLGFEYENVEGVQNVNKFLLNLRFHLKIYRGLHMTVLRPVNVKLIGVPADQAFDERVYSLAFNTADIPVDARIVLEVLAPTGERLARFHLELL
jgi:hypothetical protein